MKVVVVAVGVALIGLLAYFRIQPTVVHAKPTNGTYNAFSDSETLWKWDQYQGLQNGLKTQKGTPDPKVVRTIQMYKTEFENFKNTGEVAQIDPKTDLTFVDFYSAVTNRMKWSLVKTEGPYSFEDTKYFLKVRLPKGREYYMSEWAIEEPRPHLPGEPGRQDSRN